MYSKESDDDDLVFHTQCQSLAWVEPKNFNITDLYNDNFLKITNHLFAQISIEKSYSGKLAIIENIFSTISHVLRISKGNNFSTDDIAPLCEYALIKAKPERLSSNLKFLEIFLSEESSSLVKMHFDFLKSYMNTLKVCNYEHFSNITEEEYNDKCQREKMKLFEKNE